MYLKRATDSITFIPEILELTDNTNRLYNIGGNLYFNGEAVGSGTGDASNIWVNANDYNTYLSAQANDYTTYATLSNSINVSYAIITGNLYNTWESINTAIDTVQSNISSLPNSAANDYNTYTTVTANIYDTWKSVNTAIDTVQNNISSLPNSAANDYNTYTTVTANLYNTWESLDIRINALDSGSNTSVADLIGGIEGANNNIDTVQSNVYILDSNDGITLLSARANDYNTYTTLNDRINTIQDNVGTGISPDAITPQTDNSGYVGNTLYTWASGHFTDLTVDNYMSVSGNMVIEGNLTVTGNVATINVTELSIDDNMIYLNANSTITNPDLGFSGNYNDGIYQHAGFFRDATDGYWKVFEGYTLEPNASPFINTSHSSFTLANFQANNFIGNLTATIATVNSVNVLANDGVTLASARANDYTTYTTLAANDFSTYTTLNTRINTVNANLEALPNSAANDFTTYTALTGFINTVQNNVAAVDNNVWVNANDFSTYTTLNSRINTVNSNLEALPNSAANDYNTLLSARSNDFATYTTLNTLINTVNSNLEALPNSAANDFTTYTTLQLEYRANDYNTYTQLTSDYQANDVVTLATARGNDHSTLLSAYSNDGTTLLTAHSNDYSTYVILNGLINTVQSNLDSVGGGGGSVWTEDTGRVYYVGKVVVNSNAAQTEQFYVNGNAKVSSDFEVGGTLTESSSVRLKENIVPLNSQLNTLMRLRPVEYDKIESKIHEYGLIAEEVANVLPQVVSEGNTSIQYTRLIPTLIKAIQELTEKVDKLESK